MSPVPFLSANELIFELGFLAFGGLESFLRFQITLRRRKSLESGFAGLDKRISFNALTLLQCSSLNFKLAQALKIESSNGKNGMGFSDAFSVNEKSFEITPRYFLAFDEFAKKRFC